jgi:hypothetical protein
MRRFNNNFIFSATDLNNHLNCKHLTTLDREAAEGIKKRPNYTNHTTEVLRQKGKEFEAAHLETLRQAGFTIITIAKDGPDAYLNTIAAMEAGADVIYQGRLEEGFLVGTVDKFQGEEASVVIYSMATSKPEDAPRGVDFLYSPNRLNVAVSRARAMFIMVTNPAIFSPECKSPQQMRLANPFCEFLERMAL